MNFDDKFTKQFEEKLEKNLKLIRSMPPEVLLTVKENLLNIDSAIEQIKSNPNKSDEDLKILKDLENDLPALKQQIEDMQLILMESLYRKSLVYFENVKRLAKEGNKEAEKIYNDLRIHIEKFDVN
ncbi:hypothetical protein J2X97_002407 [Epilithonimonas hungarica]|uniref:hypothetical protein n=1 Tax=Epilithonimonas hungarica TaxID=454006 RepID=UPI0012BDD7C6|nr:hypothetical protein [Epilithonimonas hungarica]MDP9956748.1 hypothetical protein [Epilithonimonas hungarica]MPT31060.1 hypothetical protein [Chryseobacterium sp.]